MRANIHTNRLSIAAGIALAILLAGGAQAALSISDKTTSNVTCDSGVCTATAKKALLSVTDLTTMLVAGSVTVESGSEAQDITVDAPFSWTSSNALTLDANRSLTVNKAVLDSGPAALALSYGKKGDLRFGPKGNISFTSTSNSLTINSKVYTLVDSIASLAGAIANKPSGLYALAHNYDASKDGTYSSSPITTPLTGTFEGLGNVVSVFSIIVTEGGISFFGIIKNTAEIRDFGLAMVSAEVNKGAGGGGLLAGYNEGTIINSFAQGSLTSRGGVVGGLVGSNSGTIKRSHTSVTIDFGKKLSLAGGLVFGNDGLIDQSYSTGDIILRRRDGDAGGLVYENAGLISNSYATGSVFSRGGAGGFVGVNYDSGHGSGRVTDSYSTGLLSAGFEGGLIGADETLAGNLTQTYWDMDTSGIDEPSQGAGNIPNDPGITGLTDTQLKSELPVGFDPKVWAQNSKINNGYPYLIDNPPTN